jgi:endonuclease/exonuclease/phosphatase family metal-dependent hydrolase
VQFDHVLADRPMAVCDVRALQLPVSDHCALVVELEDEPPTAPAVGHW